MSCNGILITISDWLSFGYFIWEEFWGFADLLLSSLDASAERDLEGGLDWRQVSSDFYSIINNVNCVCFANNVDLSLSLPNDDSKRSGQVSYLSVCWCVCMFQSMSTHSSANIL